MAVEASSRNAATMPMSFFMDVLRKEIGRATLGAKCPMSRPER